MTTDQMLDWLGNYHFVILHFPIALIVMTVWSEILYGYSRKPQYDHAARFMIVGAAIFAIPTAFFGYAYSYNLPYTGPPHDYFWWHRFFSISTAVLSLLAAILKGKGGSYYLCLTLALICVTLAGYFGGSLTFGVGKLLPP